MFSINTCCLCSPGSQYPFAWLLLCIFQHFVSLIAHFSLMCWAVVCKSAAGNRGAFFIAPDWKTMKEKAPQVPAIAAKAGPAVSGACDRCSLPTGGQTALESLIHCGGEAETLKLRLLLLLFTPFLPHTVLLLFLLSALERCSWFWHPNVQCGAGLQVLLCWRPWAQLLASLQVLAREKAAGPCWRYPHSPFLTLVPFLEPKCCLCWSLAGPGRPPSSL